VKGEWMLESNTAICMAAPTFWFSPINSMKNEKPFLLESNSPLYMSREPLIQALRIFVYLSSLKNKVE
jgi:hypothetical protein